MRPNLVIAGLLGAVVAVAAACHDSTAPGSTPHIAPIANIKVTDHAAYSDTVKIEFNYYPASCDTGIVVQARPVADGLRFTVTSWPSNRPCPMVASTISIFLPPPVGYVVNPPHQSPLRVVFTQPGGIDSVRVVGP